jgi:hypothetical protein
LVFRLATFFLALRFVAFFFVLRLATFFLALRLATFRFGAAFFFVTFRFLATLRFEAFFLDFFLVAIIFSPCRVPGAEYIQRRSKIQRVT